MLSLDSVLAPLLPLRMNLPTVPLGEVIPMQAA
jgi:hypothetical protein